MQKTGNNAFCLHFILAVSLFLAQKTITCSKAAIETLEKGVKISDRRQFCLSSLFTFNFE